MAKNQIKAQAQIDKNKSYSWMEAIETLRKASFVKFDQSIDVSLVLNLKKNQTVRDAVLLPHSFKKEKRVLVFAKGDKAEEARAAGADFVGEMDLIDKVREGWMDFDVVLSVPDMMKDVGRLGPVLGKRGLMPNPKTKTVTLDIKEAVSEFKKGKTEFRADKSGVLNFAIGKLSMSSDALKENFQVFLNELWNKKPVDLKGVYIRQMYVSGSMTPSVKLAEADYNKR